jgi:hypothetical protein
VDVDSSEIETAETRHPRDPFAHDWQCVLGQ